MKKILVAAAIMMSMISCSKDQTISLNQETIGFDNAFINNSTKSKEDPSFKNDKMFSDFAVFGFVEGAVLFDGIKVSKTIENNDLNSAWKYEGTQYWIAGANYNFNAVAPMTNGGWTKTSAEKDATTLAFTNNGTTDLLYAHTAQQGKVSGNSAVSFDFRHVLSKVKFSFTNGYNATNATIRVKDIQITDAYKTGNVVLNATSNWSGQDGTLTLQFGNAALNSSTAEEAIAYNNTIESYNELLLIPGAGQTENEGKKTYTVTFTVELLVSGQTIAAYSHTINTPFVPEAGKSYDLTATITPENIDPNNEQEPIEFTVNTINGWGTDIENKIN